MNAKEDLDMREEYDFSQAKRGPIVSAAPEQTQVILRIDNHIRNLSKEVTDAGYAKVKRGTAKLRPGG